MGYLSDKKYIALQSKTSFIFIFNVIKMKKKNMAIIPYTFHLNRLHTHSEKKRFIEDSVSFMQKKKSRMLEVHLRCVVISLKPIANQCVHSSFQIFRFYI